MFVVRVLSLVLISLLIVEFRLFMSARRVFVMVVKSELVFMMVEFKAITSVFIVLVVLMR